VVLYDEIVQASTPPNSVPVEPKQEEISGLFAQHWFWKSFVADRVLHTAKISAEMSSTSPAVPKLNTKDLSSLFPYFHNGNRPFPDGIHMILPFCGLTLRRCVV
jgi:hypothetical protein